MAFLRLELHNHTTESDASLTCRDLLEHMIADHVDAFALTDHNTISGHRKMEALVRACGAPIQCIYGMEYTTYYGHILCPDLREYVPWDTIDPRNPEKIFRAIRETGALAGIAHPYSFGYPFATGCRFEMRVTDYSAVDFIEIFNDPEPLYTVNLPALALWEGLVLDGRRLAATCGMDLHGRQSFSGQFATFIEAKDAPAAELLRSAVRAQRTWVSKGPLLTAQNDDGARQTVFSIVDGKKSGCPVDSRRQYLMTLRLPGGSLVKAVAPNAPAVIPWSECAGLANGRESCPAIPKLYESAEQPESLLCVSPPLHLPIGASR